MKSPWTTRSIEEVYDNPWIKLTHREVITPGGSEGVYGVVHFKNQAIGIVPLDEEGNTWLVGQYRYTLGRYSWEIPEGGCPIGAESPLESARRELLEETGLQAASWQHIMDFHTSNSVTDEAGAIFLARGLAQGQPSPEDTEDLRVRKLPFAEALQMACTGEITDLMSIAGLLRVKALLATE